MTKRIIRIVIKIILSFIVLLFASILSVLVARAMGNKVATGGIGPFIIFPAAIAAMIAMWRYNPDKKKSNSISIHDQKLNKE